MILSALAIIPLSIICIATGFQHIGADLALATVFLNTFIWKALYQLQISDIKQNKAIGQLKKQLAELKGNSNTTTNEDSKKDE